MRKTLEGIERILVPKRGAKPPKPNELAEDQPGRQFVTKTIDDDGEEEEEDHEGKLWFSYAPSPGLESNRHLLERGVEEDVFLFGLHGTDMVMNHVKTRSQVHLRKEH